jgi:RNA polymerase sigma-70 factor, ECF subfamily
MIPENSLVLHAQDGDEGAFVALYERYQPAIYAYIAFRVRNGDVVEDLCAEVFVRMVDKIDTFRAINRPFLAWLYTLAHNLIADYQRKRVLFTWLPFNDELENQAQDFVEIEVDNLDHPAIRKAIQSLPEIQQQAIFLKFVEGRNNAETAALMNKTEGAVKLLQYQALDALRKRMERG